MEPRVRPLNKSSMKYSMYSMSAEFEKEMRRLCSSRTKRYAQSGAYYIELRAGRQSKEKSGNLNVLAVLYLIHRKTDANRIAFGIKFNCAKRRGHFFAVQGFGQGIG